nr:MAG TPA: hypothetical protein [Caudoviricetes sp.]
MTLRFFSCYNKVRLRVKSKISERGSERRF